jgi:hypothetical protein
VRHGPTSHSPLGHHTDIEIPGTEILGRIFTHHTDGRTSRSPEQKSLAGFLLEQIHARNFLKEAVEHALLANLKPFVKRLPNTCLFKKT